jgi:hypothetical protein
MELPSNTDFSIRSNRKPLSNVIDSADQTRMTIQEGQQEDRYKQFSPNGVWQGTVTSGTVSEKRRGKLGTREAGLTDAQTLVYAGINQGKQ